MNTKIAKLNCLMEGGRGIWEKTNDFNERVANVKFELKDKYSLPLAREKNWIKRIMLKIKLQLEIRKRIKELSSIRNLHITNV